MSRFRDVLPFSRIRSRLVLAALIVAISSAVGPSVAAGAACPSTDLSDTSNCGPWFTTPSWTDAAGWDDPSQYSTIQLADVNGDGSDELIGRGDAGLEVWRFDTKHGQWRPQVDAKGIPQSIRDFATPPPWQASNRQSPDRPQYYSTIQAADVDGGPGEEIIARFWDGVRVYRYDPPAGGIAIDGGTWTNTGAGYAFSDNMGYGDDASLYSSIHIARFKQGDPPLLYGRGRGVNAPMVLWKLEPDGSRQLGARAERSRPADFLGSGLLEAVVLSDLAGLRPRAGRPRRSDRRRRDARPQRSRGEPVRRGPGLLELAQRGLRRHRRWISAVRRPCRQCRFLLSRLPVLGGRGVRGTEAPTARAAAPPTTRR